MRQKFDEIFAATRYTKALDHIRKLRSAKQKEIKDLNSDLAVIENNMEVAHKLEDDFDDIRKSINQRSLRKKEINIRMEALNEVLDKLGNEKQEMIQWEEQFRIMNTQRNMMMEEKDRIGSTLTNNYEESDEELQLALTQFDARLAEHRKSKHEFQENITRLRNEIQRGQAERESLVRSLGKLEGQEQHHTEHVQAAHTIIGKISSMYDVPAFDSPQIDSNYNRFVEFSNQRLHKLGKKLLTSKNKYATIDKGYEETIQNNVSQINALEAQIRSSQTNCTQANTKKMQLQKRLEQITHQIQQSQTVQANINKLQRDLEAFKYEEKSRNIQSEIDEFMRKQRSSMNSATTLQIERKSLAEQQEQLNSLKYKQNQVLSLRTRFNASLKDLQPTSSEMQMATGVLSLNKLTWPKSLPSISIPEPTPEALIQFGDNLPSLEIVAQLESRLQQTIAELNITQNNLQTSSADLGLLAGEEKSITAQLGTIEHHISRCQEALNEEVLQMSEVRKYNFTI